jgi:hypothetical protein
MGKLGRDWSRGDWSIVGRVGLRAQRQTNGCHEPVFLKVGAICAHTRNTMHKQCLECHKHGPGRTPTEWQVGNAPCMASSAAATAEAGAECTGAAGTGGGTADTEEGAAAADAGVTVASGAGVRKRDPSPPARRSAIQPWWWWHVRDKRKELYTIFTRAGFWK